MYRADRRPLGCPGRLASASNRREFLERTGAGFGMLALAGMLADDAKGAGQSPPQPHFAPRAKNVIFLFMDGGPSHVDTFDPKPALAKQHGKSIGDAGSAKKSVAGASRVWFGSPWKFAQHGKSGLWVSDLLPHIARCADELCVVRSMVGELPLHGQQNLLLHTGRVLGQAPSLGAWVSYGLGSENQNLPSYMLLNNDWVPNGGMENFGSSFLPATHQAVMVRAKGTPVDNIVPHDDRTMQQRKLELLAKQDRVFAAQTSDAAAIESAIQNYETAFRMQSLIPELADERDEPEHIRTLYGLDAPNEYQKFYGLQCLRARRLVEAGVRFVEVTCPPAAGGNSPWDQHGKLKELHTLNALITDQAVAALIADLRQRGLLDQTIVLWAGEMGRTPHTAKISETSGRDHHVNGYSLFMAGGGFRPGTAFGQTDELGNTVVDNPVTIHDIHATVLHQLGIDHARLTYRFGGRDMRLTDVHGRVLNELLS
ncbi:MAG TPA: DUF1501 domain-containing protein [Pirellulales bacterium]|nr:DUF1501 domain-containing protein [Pirellulales bacterium]